jgi:hypothetical protein
MSESNAHDEFIKKYRQLNGLPDEKIIQIGDYFPVNENRYKKKKVASPKPKPKQKKNYKGKIAFVGTLAAAIAGVAGFAIGTSNQSPTITSTTAVYTMGESPEELGINDEMFNKIQNIKLQLQNGDISNSDLIRIAPDLYTLTLDVTQNKISKLFGVEPDDIKLNIQDGETGNKNQILNVYDKGKKQTYYNKELGRTKSSMPKEISDLIIRINDMKNVMLDIQNSNLDRTKILSIYKDTIDKIDKFVPMELSLDENSNIIANAIYSKDIAKVVEGKGNTQQTKQKIQEEYKTSDDSYSVNANGNVDNQDTVKFEYDDDAR